MHLARPLSPEHCACVAAALRAMTGIKAVSAGDESIEIVYDRLRATAGQIEAKLAETGVQLSGTWAERLSLAFAHDEEEPDYPRH